VKSFGTLYISYFGLREPLVQTQVLPYLRGLAQDGIAVHLLTFDASHPVRETSEVAADRASLARDGIRWFSRRYHKRPSVPATMFDIAAGAWLVRRLVRQYDVDVLHARSHIPLAMTLAARLWTSKSVVFDVRGLLADEYVTAGRWNQSSLVYRTVKGLEQIGLRKADQIIVLTRRAQEWVVGQGVAPQRIECVPCCVDCQQFSSEVGPDERSQDPLQIVYLGSVTGNYRLDLAARFVGALRARHRQAVLKILTAASPADVARALEQTGLETCAYSVGFVPPAETARALRGSAAGVCFMHDSASAVARSPAKISEYLAAGLPVVVSAGVGDLDDLIAREQVGVVLRSPSADDVDAAAARLLELLDRADIHRRCRAAAERHFDLTTVGIPGYRNVYRRLRGLQPSANLT
jgi:glycosyltransferase involved in cell wall biosynthesis